MGVRYLPIMITTYCLKGPVYSVNFVLAKNQIFNCIKTNELKFLICICDGTNYYWITYIETIKYGYRRMINFERRDKGLDREFSRLLLIEILHLSRWSVRIANKYFLGSLRVAQSKRIGKWNNGTIIAEDRKWGNGIMLFVTLSEGWVTSLSLPQSVGWRL